MLQENAYRLTHIFHRGRILYDLSKLRKILSLPSFFLSSTDPSNTRGMKQNTRNRACQRERERELKIAERTSVNALKMH